MHIAKANLRKQKSAAISLFIIIALVSSLCAIGMSMILGVARDYEAGIERLNGLHSLFVMSKIMFTGSFDAFIKNDPRVAGYEVGEAIYINGLHLDYGGEIDQRVMILNASDERTISAPRIYGTDNSISPETGIYLPAFAGYLGYETGDPFVIIYRNKPINLVVAGFFETSEFATPNEMEIKFFAPDESYAELKRQMGSSVWIAIRFFDPYDSTAFNEDFRARIEEDITFDAEVNMAADFLEISDPVMTPTMILSVILILFALVIIMIALLVTRFRVANSIEDSMHAIGVLKASGYANRQIVACYMAEYSVIALPAALLGILLALPAFSVIRQALERMTGRVWTLGVDITVGFSAAILVAAALLWMVWRSSRKIRELPPVDALRGGIASDNRRRNAFPLYKGAGNVHTRLGLKSTAAYAKQYIMIGFVLAAATFTVIIIAALYQNFVIDHTALIRMTGIEMSDVDLIVARHTDADKLAAELERLPEVKKTTMFDWRSLQIEGVSVTGYVSCDFGALETVSAHDGRLPIYDNEIVCTKLLASRFGKTLGDGVWVKTNGVALEYIICGFFSSTNNAGRACAITLEGYQRLDPNYRRSNIEVYLEEGVGFDIFSEILKTRFGVVNVYQSQTVSPQDDLSVSGSGRFAAAKIRAEEKIANYLEYYGIDSVEYAVIYNGEIILSGSSAAYQIEKITDFNAWANTQVGAYGNIVKLLTQAVSLISLCIIALILTMSVRQIITKRRRELGILKSCGFTTPQLARQLAISFLPYSALGVLVGCVSGALVVNPAITAMFASSGVYNANVYISSPAAVAIGVLVLLFTFAAAHVSAMRIKHITAYELVSE